MSGNLSSASKANINSGRENANVFPDPVKAMPIISLPESLKAGKMASDNGLGTMKEKLVRLTDELTLPVNLGFE
jgi:hypothetical protein